MDFSQKVGGCICPQSETSNWRCFADFLCKALEMTRRPRQGRTRCLPAIAPARPVSSMSVFCAAQQGDAGEIDGLDRFVLCVGRPATTAAPLGHSFGGRMVRSIACRILTG